MTLQGKETKLSILPLASVVQLGVIFEISEGDTGHNNNRRLLEKGAQSLIPVSHPVGGQGDIIVSIYCC